jgi:hypothetical protein
MGKAGLACAKDEEGSSRVRRRGFYNSREGEAALPACHLRDFGAVRDAEGCTAAMPHKSLFSGSQLD